MEFFCIFSFPVSGNAEFAFDLALWTFKQRGVLRVAGVEHHRVGERSPPAAYTIEDKVVCVKSSSFLVLGILPALMLLVYYKACLVLHCCKDNDSTVIALGGKLSPTL